MKPSLDQLNGIIWAMIVLTSMVFFARAVIRLRRPRQVVAADYILLAAYLFFLVQAIYYLATIRPIYRWQAATAGQTAMYADYVADLITMRKVMLVNSYVLWCTLWSVKFAFLSLYWKLVQQLPLYVKMWWAVTIFTVLAFIGNIPAHLASCRKLDFFEPAGCLARQDQIGQLISLYYSFSADVATDLAGKILYLAPYSIGQVDLGDLADECVIVMFLPLAVIRNLQVARPKKIGIGILFSIGWICIAFAIIRVIQLGEGQGQFIPGWLAMWGTIEGAIAVTVGCGPGLYVSAKEAYKTRGARSYGTGGSVDQAQSGNKWFNSNVAGKSWSKMGESMRSNNGEIKVESRFEMREIKRKDSDGDAELLDHAAWPLEDGSAHSQASRTTFGAPYEVDRREWRKSSPSKKGATVRVM